MNWWQVISFGFIMFCIGKHASKHKVSSDKTLILQKQSLTGRIGAAISAHVMLSVVSGILGYNVIIAVLCIVLSLPLMLFGAKVELPEHVKEWPRSVLARVKETLVDVKDDIKEKVHDKKEAVMDRFGGHKEQSPDAAGEVKPAALTLPDRLALERKAKELKEKAAEEIRLQAWEAAGRRARKLVLFWEN